jgi:hypothetical protein
LVLEYLDDVPGANQEPNDVVRREVRGMLLVVRNAARVVEELSHGDASAVGHHLWDERLDAVVEADFLLVDELQHDHRYVRLGQAADAEPVVDLQRDIGAGLRHTGHDLVGTPTITHHEAGTGHAGGDDRGDVLVDLLVPSHLLGD